MFGHFGYGNQASRFRFRDESVICNDSMCVCVIMNAEICSSYMSWRAIQLRGVNHVLRVGHDLT